LKIVTSVTVFHDAVGLRMSVTYSEVDETGQIIADNMRYDRIITDADKINDAESLIKYAAESIDGE